MKKILALLLFLLFIILAWFSWKWYKNTILCCDDANQIEATKNLAPQTEKSGPLVFNWNSEKAVTNDLWLAQKKEILSVNTDNKILRIDGPFYKDEVNNTTFENLGLARADAIRQLLIDSIPSEKIEIDSHLEEFYEEAKTMPFGGTVLNWDTRNENIKEIENKTLIYFPYNSTDKLDNDNISTYLSSVADALKGNDKTVTLTGHTDNIGNPPFNKKLAMLRAIAMKKLLVSSGVDASRITLVSEGQAKPIASNDTEEGRQKNRRVELEIK